MSSMRTVSTPELGPDAPERPSSGPAPSSASREVELPDPAGGQRASLALIGSWFSLLALLIVPSLTTAGHLLLLDWTPTPTSLWQAPPPLVLQSIPLETLIRALEAAVPTWLLQRLILLFSLTVAGVAAYRTAPVGSRLARLYAGTLYVLNPFVYTRLLAGHWTLLIAYAFAPFAVRAIVEIRSEPSRRNGLVAGLWIAGLSLICAHALLLLIPLAIASVLAHRSLGGCRSALQAYGWCWLIVALGTMWWIVPAATVGLAPSSGVETIDVFASTSLDGSSVPMSVAGLRGFWIEGMNPTGPPGWQVMTVLLIGLALTGACAGVRDERRTTVVTMVASALVASVLAIGVAWGPTEALARAFYRWVPGGVAFREPHKLVGLLVLAYAWLGSIGVEAVCTRRSGRPRRWIALACLALALALAPELARGLDGRLRPVEYPASWAKADQIMRSAEGTRALVLPWRLYLPLPFNDAERQVANPAEAYFSTPVIVSIDPELGNGLATPDDDVSRRIGAVLKGPVAGIGAELSELDIGFVLIVPGPGEAGYAWLVRSPDLETVLDSPDLILLRNRVRPDPPTHPAPRRG